MQFTNDNEAVDFSLTVPPQACIGEPVPITLVIRNTQTRTIGLVSAGREITFDILVARAGTVVWRRLEGRTVALSLEVRMLPPGASIELRDTWHAEVDAGRYTVVGRILTDGAPLDTPPAELDIFTR